MTRPKERGKATVREGRAIAYGVDPAPSGTSRLCRGLESGGASSRVASRLVSRDSECVRVRDDLGAPRHV